jgi:hypothetical protein
MQAEDIFPYLIGDDYFRLDLPPGVTPPVAPKFPPHRPVGHGLSVLLMADEGAVRKAVHESDLADAGISFELAEQLALDNLTALIDGGKTFQVRKFETPSGLHCAGWLGNELTASVLLWPSLFKWARETLACDRVLVSAPQRQFLFVLAFGDPEFRSAIRAYIQNVVRGMDKRLSDELFELTADGIVPSISD